MSVTRETITFKQFKTMLDQLEEYGLTIEKEKLGDQFVTYAKTPKKGKVLFKGIIHDRDTVYASWMEGLFNITK